MEMTEKAYRIMHFDSIDSTSAEAKRQILSGNYDTMLYVARTQTGGMGRLGRSFASPYDNGVYMTLAYYTEWDMQTAVSITSAAAVVVRNCLYRHTNKKTEIKWVNDLYYKGKKVCGILCQTLPSVNSQKGMFVMVGIGINLGYSEFPMELSEIAGSLQSDCDRDALILDIADGLLGHAKNPDDRSYMRDYREYSMVLGKDVICTRADESYTARVLAICDDGALLLQLQDGSNIILDSGEVSLRLSPKSAVNGS